MPALTPELDAIAQPANTLERWFASEIEYASRELDRVRANTNNTEAELRLNAAYSRASRNWNRARKELQTLQNARIAHATRLTEGRQLTAKAAPLADPSRIPQPRMATNNMIDHLIQQIGTGMMDPNSITIVQEQEAR